MSLQMNWNSEVPADTAEVGCTILAESDVYRVVGDGVNGVLSLADFTDLYSRLGRGAICPIVQSLVTVFQALENVPDRVAARWAVTRIDWKYALHMPLRWQGFNYSDLSNFRARLLEHEAERLVFEKVLGWIASLGFVKKHGMQRSNSTHVLGNVERLSRLEMVWETMRVTLRAMKRAAPEWYEEVIPAAFDEAYVKRQSDWRMSKEAVKRETQIAGGDGFWLLDRLNESTPERALNLPEIETLRVVWAQQFERHPQRKKVKVLPPSGRGKGKDLIVTPHDPEARWSEKRGKDWVGYRLEVTETAEDDVAAQFITDVDVVAANKDDSEVVDGIQERLTARNLKPKEQYVDCGYTSGANLARSVERGIELMGPVAGDTSGKAEGFRQSDFALEFEAQRAVCPQGKTAPAWYDRPQADGYVGAEIQFRAQCDGCPVRASCAPGKNGRTLSVSPYHALLSKRRAQQETASFRNEMKRRPAVEGTISELVRVHGARRARYRGLDRARLQALFIAAATNLKRAARVLAENRKLAAKAAPA